MSFYNISFLSEQVIDHEAKDRDYQVEFKTEMFLPYIIL